uniref:ADP,ATP carrier protein n=1 Tax=Alexandrium monilatum TaxID=311494 RepID=A0A7S4S3U7_9DINO|mmetsp:Transcript_101080/g.301546  ORF Transcript_101080/g.301546 Transcript_101080/m.301546 type:complete len:323 (-) Transcript_101080:45-1013(-)
MVDRDSELRSRCFRRCCPRRPSAACGPGVKFPEAPLILAGAFGGPFCIFLYTPLRNALTLASQNAESSAWQLYCSTFEGGFSSGWTGGFAPVLPSCPQFCVMGPLFHFFKEALGSAVLAVLLSALAETTISIGSQTLNAQMAFNRDQRNAGSDVQVPLWNPLIPYGPGTVVHVTRNIVALSGIRIFSKPCQAALRWAARMLHIELPEGVRLFLGDFVASLGAAVLSAPFNQLYNFAVTSQAYMDAGPTGKVTAMMGFLMENYLVFNGDGEVVGLSSTLARDLCMRCAYVATLYTTFSAIERLFVFLAESRKRRRNGKAKAAE